MRLDKYLSDMKYGTRSSLKKDIKNGLVSVNGVIVRQSEHQVQEGLDEICYRNVPCVYEKYVYYMLYKPAGVISATEDKKEKTVVSLLKDTGRTDLFPVGRLDKDTEGLLLLTNDGALSHALLAPGRHVEKAYECVLADPLTQDQKYALEQGVDIGEKRKTLPAKVAILAEQKIMLTITEGKFHQVKRMLQAVGNRVMHLKRIRMGNLILDGNLNIGEYRKLTKEEIIALQTINKQNVRKPSLTGQLLQEQPQKILDLEDYDAIIFDLDGSLVDSMWLWHAIDVEYLGKFGKEVPENLQEMIGGRSFSETALYFKEMFQIPDEIEQIKADWNRMAWDKYTHEVPLKEGVREFIEYCMQKHKKLGIATSNSRELVENVIAAHALDAHFTCITTGCEVKKGKPEPDVYLATAKTLAVSPARCLVFEDIVHGIMAGQAAGMTVCAVYDENSVAQDEEKRSLADFYIHDYTDLQFLYRPAVPVEGA